MDDCAIQCDRVWKRFTRGERANSLRDALPALARWALGRRRDELGERQFWALSDVSFEVQRGEVLGIIGPNGAGKSTLLKILTSILVPNRGSIGINGRLTALIEVGAGFHQDLTGRENVYLNGAILGMSRREITRKIGEIVDFAGVAEFLDTPVKRYSSGMQARLGFSIAAHMDPDILLVDEVLAVGDAQFQQRCLERMHYFANSGRSIIFISHNLQAVSELCPQTLLLINGRRECLGPTAEVIQTYMTTMKEQDMVPMRGPVSIHRVRLLDEQGDECNKFSAAGRARLTFDLAIVKPPSKYFLGFVVKRVTDGLIAAIYNLDLPLGDDVQGPVPMAIDFQANLLTGSYSITLFLIDKATYDKLVYLDFVKIFNVDEPSAYAGITHVAPRLTVQQAALTTST
ncbi:MAG: ABC transporter ATP-binding protein [Planctomycetota bacterium]|nr:ABC transporter ATP-binding protein [Planctomycetota bacterium]